MGKAKKFNSKLANLKPAQPKMSSKKNRKQPSGGAFKVSSHKAMKLKNRAKAVTTNLKRINENNKRQVVQSNSSFSDLQQSLAKESSKQKQKQPQKQPTKSASPLNQEAEMSIDDAINRISSL